MPAQVGARRVLFRAIVIAAHHHRAAHDDLARLAGRAFLAVAVDDLDLHERGRPACAAAAQPHHDGQATDLGLPVAAHGLHQRRSGRHDQGHAPVAHVGLGEQAAEVVPAVRVERAHLLDGGLGDVAMAGLLVRDQRQEFGRLHARDEDVAAARDEGAQHAHHDADVEHRAGSQIDALLVHELTLHADQALKQQRGVRQQGGVGPTVERGGVDGQQGQVAVDLDVDVRRALARQQRLVAFVRGEAVLLDPQALGGVALPKRLREFADFATLPEHDAGIEVLQHHLPFGLAHPPVGRADDGTELGGGQQQLEQAERVLRHPQHAAALRDSVATQGRRELVDASIELQIGQAHFAVDARQQLRAGAGLFAQGVAQRVLANAGVGGVCRGHGVIVFRQRRIRDVAAGTTGLRSHPVCRPFPSRKSRGRRTAWR